MRRLLAIALCLLLAAPTAGAAAPPGNAAPLADAGLDRTVRVGEATLLDGGGSLDPDGRLARYEWRVETPAGERTRPPNATAERTRFVPGTVGRYTVTLSVTDDDGAERTDTLFVDVRRDTDPARAAAPNAPPAGYVAGPASVVAGVRAAFRANVTDPDGRVVDRSWSTGGDGPRTTATFDDPGEATLSVVVTDDDGATRRLNRTVTVRPPDANRAPTVTLAGPDRIAVGERAAFTLRAHDPDGAVERFEWTAPAATAGSALTRTFADPGTYVVRGRAVDDDGATATAARTVRVYADGPPAATLAGPDAAPAGSVREYRLAAFDPDGGPVAVSWDHGNARRAAESGSSDSRFETRVRLPDDPGATVTVSATVTDDEGDRVTVDRAVALTDGPAPALDVSGIEIERTVDDPYQTATDDTIEGATYAVSARVERATPGRVTAVWAFGDGTTTRRTLAPGRADTAVTHLFTSANGSRQSRTVRVTVTDAAGNTATARTRRPLHTVATHRHVAFDAADAGGGDGSTGVDAPADGPETLSTTVGRPVSFVADPLQPFRVEYGDGRVEEFERSRVPTRFSHAYDAPGTYTVQLTTVQGSDGYGAAWAVVHVVSTSTDGGTIVPPGR